LVGLVSHLPFFGVLLDLALCVEFLLDLLLGVGVVYLFSSFFLGSFFSIGGVRGSLSWWFRGTLRVGELLQAELFLEFLYYFVEAVASLVLCNYNTILLLQLWVFSRPIAMHQIWCPTFFRPIHEIFAWIALESSCGAFDTVFVVGEHFLGSLVREFDTRC